MWANRLVRGVLITLAWILCGVVGSQLPAAEPSPEVANPSEMHVDAAPQESGAAADDQTDHATGHAADPTSNNPVSVDPDLAIVTALVFLVLLAVLWKFAWGPIVEAIDHREKIVADNLADAQRSTEEARQLLSDHQSKLAGATAEVKQMLDQARRDAESQKQQIVGEAQTAAQSEKQRALREIDAAKTAALQDLARTSVDTAVNLAGKIVQRQLSDEDQARLINDALQQFPSDN